MDRTDAERLLSVAQLSVPTLNIDGCHRRDALLAELGQYSVVEPVAVADARRGRKVARGSIPPLLRELENGEGPRRTCAAVLDVDKELRVSFRRFASRHTGEGSPRVLVASARVAAGVDDELVRRAVRALPFSDRQRSSPSSMPNTMPRPWEATSGQRQDQPDLASDLLVCGGGSGI